MFAFTRKDIDAKVVGNALVVAFTGAEVQKTWRADMATVSTASLELREENRKYSVVMKKPAGEEVIATFPERESAAYALSAITDAMMKGDTQIVAAQGGRGMIVMMRLFKAAVVLVLVAILYLFLAPAVFGPEVFQKTNIGRPRPGMEQRPGSQIKSGEALPADEVFK